MTKLADCEVADPPLPNVAVTPVPLTAMLGLVRLVPVIVTGTVVPCAPVAGVNDVMVGNGAVTVKFAVAEPDDVVIVTVCTPVVAVPAITKLADCEVAVPPPDNVAVTPVPATLMLAPLKLVPAMTTGTVVPCTPVAGVNEVMVGAGEVTVKGLLVTEPLEVVMVKV
jgi:hypothetical protein